MESSEQQKSWSGDSDSPQSTIWSSRIGSSPPPPTPKVEKIKTRIDTKHVMASFQSKQALINDQIQHIQANFNRIEKEKEKQSNDDVLGIEARNDHQKQRPKSGSVNESDSRTGMGGTGVFLPRVHDTVVETLEVPGGSRVIIPGRVLEVLKSHFKNLNETSKFSSLIPPFHDAALLVPMKNKSSSSTWGQSELPYMAEMVAKSHQELPADLPHEWTY